MKIGLFDSGLGGLLVMKAVVGAVPQYDYEYYGDTKNLPYGDKTEEEIYLLTKAGVQHLFQRGCLIVILACNTASAETLRRLQDEWLRVAYPDRRILGVIIPMVETLIDTMSPKVLLLATSRTVDSGKYQRELYGCQQTGIEIEALATPDLVPLIESGQREVAYVLMRTYIDERLDRGLTGVILGCTHYCMFAGELSVAYAGKLTIFAQTEIIPQKLSKYLQLHPELEALLSRGGERNVYLTEHRPEYDRLMGTILRGHFLAEEAN